MKRMAGSHLVVLTTLSVVALSGCANGVIDPSDTVSPYVGGGDTDAADAGTAAADSAVPYDSPYSVYDTNPPYDSGATSDAGGNDTGAGGQDASVDATPDVGCPAGQILCGGTCIDPTGDPNNCGSCGMVCGSGTTCTNSSCAPTCTAPKQICSGSCVNTQTDPNNCGSCGKSCGGASCTAGKCCSSVGSCGHSLCTSGAAVTSGCDSAGVAACTCAGDPVCCQSTWDSICVSEAQTYCSLTCTGGC